MRSAHLLAAASLLASSALAAKPTLTIAPFPGANAARSQLVDALCSELTCAPQGPLMRRGRPDWRKVRAKKVQFVLTGRKAKVRRKAVVVLELLKAPGSPRFRKRFPLDARGRLSARTLAAARSELLETLGVAPEPEQEDEPAPTESPRAEAPVTEEPAEAPAREVPPEPAPPPSAVASEPASEPAEPSGEPAHVETRRRAGREHVLALEAGPEFTSRRLAYTQGHTANLLWYHADLIVLARVRAEFFPLAASEGLASGLGLEASYAHAVGLKSQLNDGPLLPTHHNRLDLAAKLEATVVEALGLTLVPAVGFRHTTFRVAPAPDGTVLDGLPAVSYAALVLGLAAELRFSDGRFVTFGRAAYLPVLSSGEIISASYFPKGWATGLEGELGVGLRLLPRWHARLTGYLTRYGLTFRPAPDARYSAPGVVDQYLGMNFAVRHSF